MKLDIFSDDLEGRPYYEANVWIYNGKGDPLALEYYSTKREAVAFIKRFKKAYKGNERLDCFVKLFDEEQCCQDSWDVD